MLEARVVVELLVLSKILKKSFENGKGDQGAFDRKDPGQRIGYLKVA